MHRWRQRVSDPAPCSQPVPEQASTAKLRRSLNPAQHHTLV